MKNIIQMKNIIEIMYYENYNSKMKNILIYIYTHTPFHMRVERA